MSADGRRMRVLVVNQFYPPDLAPTGQLLRDVAVELARRGHVVSVLCSAQAYAGEGLLAAPADAWVRVVRVGRRGTARRGAGGRLADQLAFHAAAFRQARWLERVPDVVVSLTTPPLIGLTLQRAFRGTAARHVAWMMDLYPHVLAAHGMLRETGWPYRLLLALTRRMWRQSSRVVALSPGMAAHIDAALGGTEAGPPVLTIPYWAPEGLTPWAAGEPNPLRQRRGWAEDETVLLYSGNLGLGHTVTPFLEQAGALAHVPRLRWVFAGDSRRLSPVAAFARSHPAARVECLPYAGPADVRAHLAAADVHLASLREGWAGLIVPSKLPAAFAMGRPVLFAGPPKSDPARWIRESGGGWAVAQDDREGFAAAVAACREPAERERRGAAALAFARSRFSRAANCGLFVSAVEELAPRAAGGNGTS